MSRIRIGSECPTKKLEIIGFNKFDTLLIRFATFIFRKRNLTITVTRDRQPPDLSYILYIDGNVGIGT